MGVPATDKPACRINFGGVGHVPIYLAGSGAKPLFLKTLLCFTVLSFALSSFDFTYKGGKGKSGTEGHSKANSLWCFPSKFSQLQNKSCLWSSLLLCGNQVLLGSILYEMPSTIPFPCKTLNTIMCVKLIQCL